MRVAAKPRCAVVFLMVLTLGVSLGLPAEDVLETVCDESEALPFESIPLISIVTPLVAARTTRAVLSSLHLRHSAPSMFAPAQVPDTDTSRPTDRGTSLALLCTLLC
jgi:hypothetical protein